FGPTDAELPVAEVHVAPLERDHLAAAYSRLAAQQSDEVGPCVETARRCHEPFVLFEVVELRRALRHGYHASREEHKKYAAYRLSGTPIGSLSGKYRVVFSASFAKVRCGCQSGERQA